MVNNASEKLQQFISFLIPETRVLIYYLTNRAVVYKQYTVHNRLSTHNLYLFYREGFELWKILWTKANLKRLHMCMISGILLSIAKHVCNDKEI
jgi:hypothetical protein